MPIECENCLKKTMLTYTCSICELSGLCSKCKTHDEHLPERVLSMERAEVSREELKKRYM